jgi:hypothetical protein
MGNNDSTIVISQNTQGTGDATAFLTRLQNSGYAG